MSHLKENPVSLPRTTRDTHGGGGRAGESSTKVVGEEGAMGKAGSDGHEEEEGSGRRGTRFGGTGGFEEEATVWEWNDAAAPRC